MRPCFPFFRAACVDIRARSRRRRNVHLESVCIFEVSVPAGAAAVAAAVEFISPFLSTVFLYLAFASTPALDSQTKQFECIGSLTLIRHVSSTSLSPVSLFPAAPFPHGTHAKHTAATLPSDVTPHTSPIDWAFLDANLQFFRRVPNRTFINRRRAAINACECEIADRLCACVEIDLWRTHTYIGVVSCACTLQDQLLSGKILLT